MTTSGITANSYTAQQLITGAFGKLNLLVDGIADPDMSTAAMGDLNLMLKTWAVMPRLWLASSGSQALTSGQAAYTLAAGVRKVLTAQRRTGGVDISLGDELGRSEYDALPTKSATGMPVNWYQDRQRGAVTVYLWNAPDSMTAGNTTLQYTYARQIEIFTALTQTADLPDEWEEALIYNLADRLIPTYGADAPTTAKIQTTAASLLGQLSGEGQEEASIFMQPASQFNR